MKKKFWIILAVILATATLVTTSIATKGGNGKGGCSPTPWCYGQ
jgi:hypothetical protein